MENQEKPIKTEMQQLKENALMEKAKDKALDVTNTLLELYDKEFERLRWLHRAGILSAFVFTTYFGFLIIMMWQEVAQSTQDVISEIHFLILLVAVAREAKLGSEYQRAKGERIGYENALIKLGLMREEECDCDDCKGKREKKRVAFKSPFKRFKEFFERVGSKKPEEAFA